MAKIADIKAYEILDSRGNPSIKAQIILDDGLSACASVPSGASKGTYEALELRDHDPKRFNGLGVKKAVEIIQTVFTSKLRGLDPSDQKKIDELLINMDGTENKGKYGANSILAVSLACAKAAASKSGLPLYEYLSRLYGEAPNHKLPIPMFNVINGGLHGCGKFNFQEFLLIPKKDYPFREALRMGEEIYQILKKILKEKNLIYSTGDEGGFTPQFANNEEVMDFLIESISHSVYQYGSDVHLGLDFAASSFFHNNSYQPVKDEQMFPKQDYIDYLDTFARKYKLNTLEDGLYEDDWEGWQEINNRLGNSSVIIGDDLLVTNEKRLKKAIELKACNGIIIKPNQIGTLSETLEVVKIAKSHGFKIIVSHRSGETNDDFIADLAVGVNADFTKFGAPARGERVEKYNRLLEISSQLDKLY